MADVERRSAALELREGGDGRTVAGVLVPYGEVSHDTPFGDERFVAHAFKRSIGQRKGLLKLFRAHRQEAPVALATVTDTAQGVLIEARLADTALGNETLAEVREGLLDSFSVGFRAIRERTANGVREVLEAALIEGSLVAVPAYGGARVLSLRDGDPGRVELPPAPEVWAGHVVIDGVRWS